MQLEIILLGEVSQKEKDKCDNIYMWNLKCRVSEHLWNRFRPSDQTCGCQGGERRGSRMDWDLGAGRCKLLYIKWVYNQAVWYSTGNYIQSPGISHMVFVYAQSSLTHIVSHIDHTLWSYGLWPTWFLCP